MNEKNRHWTFILYPESALPGWKDYLQETGLPFAVSPLHNNDVTDTGEFKKEHYHVLVCFPGPTTFNKVNTLCKEINATMPKRVLSIVGIYRYFTHKDNIDKAQYNEEDIITLNGFNIKEYTSLTPSQTLQIKKDILRIIIDNNIREYSILIDYLLKNELNDYLHVASLNTMFFDRYLCSKRIRLSNVIK